MSNLLPKSHQEFSHKEYWEMFFKKLKGRAFEWYGEYPELSKYLDKYIKNKDKILIVGCGNSTLGKDLYDVGYRNIKNIDISHTVIKQMLNQNKDRPGLEFIQMDALEMSFEDNSFNVIIDKGTLDALMPDGSLETLEKIEKYLKEIERVLSFSGRYICITLLQNHILDKILNYFPSNNWMFRIVRCYEAEKKAMENKENTMPVFMVISTKFKSLPHCILELNLSPNDKIHRVENIEDVKEQISSLQQAAYVCSSLKNYTLDGNEVYFDLYEPRGTKPRFTLYIVDTNTGQRDLQYAAFIVPQGREAEWLFSTRRGRMHLVKTVKYLRLAIITMHRNQEYGTFEDIQNELTEIVCTLAPAKLSNKKIPFLSLGLGAGKRQIRYEGKSDISGDYIVEDVEIDDEKIRRFYYLSSQLVIQSEAKLKMIKTRKGPKEVVDLTHLSCQHHIYMSIAAKIACHQNTNGNGGIVVIGLGGGGLCSFLHKFIPKTKIFGVDIDKDMVKVAQDWFGFKQDDCLKAIIMDGVDYLRDLAENGKKMNAILFDVDCKDTNIGMSCPPKNFLEEKVLDNVLQIIGNNNGLFVLNLVVRDVNLRPVVLNDLKKKFKSIITFKLDDELNEIVVCSSVKETEENFVLLFKNATKEMQTFLKKNHSDCMDGMDLCNIFEKSIKIIA